MHMLAKLIVPLAGLPAPLATLILVLAGKADDQTLTVAAASVASAISMALTAFAKAHDPNAGKPQ